MGKMRAVFCIFLVLSPSCFALDLLHASSQEKSVGRQFSEDPLYNYFGWGFIAGLMDYFIRAQFSTMTTTDTMSTDTSSSDDTRTALDATQSGIEGADDDTDDDDEVEGAVVETVKKVRNKNKQKKNKKNKKHGMKKKDSQKKMETETENEEAVVNV